MYRSKAVSTKNLLLKILVITFLSITTTSLVAAAECPAVVIDNFIDIDPSPTPYFDDANYAYYLMISGDNHNYTDSNGVQRNFTVSKQNDIWAVNYKSENIKAIVFFRQHINGANGAAPQGTSETLEILFNSGPVDLLNFIISDVDFQEGVRVIGYLGNTAVTPTISNMLPTQRLSYLASGEAQWFADSTNNDHENLVSFNQPINKLLVTSYKTTSGDLGDKGGFNLHGLMTSECPKPKTVPTLSEWSLIILLMLLSMIGFGFKPPAILNVSKNG